MIGDDAVRKATGHDWAEWLKLLDRAGARKMTHREIVDVVGGQFDAGPWWQQMVAVTYEQKRGLRELHQKTDGFSASVSRTFAVPVSELFAAWQDARGRAKWLGRRKLTVRKSTADKSMRITWPDDSSVEVNFYAKGDAKSQVAVQHAKLKDKAAVAEKKELWSEALGKLKAILE